jgi:hypothetical protein
MFEIRQVSKQTLNNKKVAFPYPQNATTIGNRSEVSHPRR